MSKKILWIVCCMTISQAYSQTCENFLFLQKNKTVEITLFDKKGEPEGKQVYHVSDVQRSGGGVTGSLASEMFDKKGNSMMKANSSIQCNGGVFMIDMKMMMSQQQSQRVGGADAKAQSFYLEYPATMNVGDALKDGNLTMDISSKAPGAPPGPPGPSQTLTMVISDRKVEAKEKVTTPAGTWDCFRISYKSKVTLKTGPFGIPIKMEGVEWYAPGFGIVKTQSKNSSTMVTSIK